VRAPRPCHEVGGYGDHNHAQRPEAVDEAGILDDDIDPPARQEEGADNREIGRQELGDFHGGLLRMAGGADAGLEYVCSHERGQIAGLAVRSAAQAVAGAPPRWASMTPTST